MKTLDANQKKYRELVKFKRRILDKMRKHRKALAKARVEKKNVNEEITRLRKSGFAFSGMTNTEASRKVSNEINSVTTEDIYPNDLERKFDKLEQNSAPKFRRDDVDTSDVDEEVDSILPTHNDNYNGVVSIPGDDIVDFGGSDADEEELSDNDFE